MAFYNGDLEEEENENGTGQATGPESGTIAGSGDGSAPGAAPSSAKPEPFVGITQYINANKPQAERLAGQVAGKVDEKAAGVDTAIGAAQNSFNQAADSQKVAADEDLFNQVKSNATSVVADPSKAGSFAKLRDASYGGPTKLQDINGGQDWAGVQSALQKAKDARAATGTEAGRMGLIKEVSNNPRQSQGALTFDNLLLQSNPNAAGRLKNAGSAIDNIDQKFEGANQTAAQKAAEIKALNEGVAGQAKGALSAGYQGLSSDLAAREAKGDAEQLANVNALKNAIQTGKLTPEMLAQLKMGLNDKTHGVDLSQFINYQDGVDKYSVANQDDIARQNALKSLAGDYGLGDDILNSSTEIGRKGAGFNADLAKFGAAKDEKTSAFNKEMNAPQPITGKKTSWSGMPLRERIDKLTYLVNGGAEKLGFKENVKGYQTMLTSALQKEQALKDKYNIDKTLGQGIPNIPRTAGV